MAGKKRKVRPSAAPQIEPQPLPQVVEAQLQEEQVVVQEEQIEQQQQQQQTIEEEPEQQQQQQEGEEEDPAENMEDDENDNGGGEQQEEEEALAGVNEATEANDKGGEEVEEDMELEEEPVEKILEPFGKDQLVVLVKEAVTKHPELMELLHRLADADPAHRKIFVHGLGWDTTAETLTSVFGKYGEIEDCKAVVDKVSGKSKGYAFILFKHRSGARKALKQPQKNIGNRVTSCQLASAGPVPAPPPTASPVSEYTQRKIFVSNVAAEVDIGKLVEFFSKFGEIEDGPLGLDKNTGKPKGFCLFVYKSVESAKKALEEPHKNFEGVTLHCQKAIDGPKPGKPFFQQQQQHHHGGHHQQQHHPYNRKDRNKYSAGGGGAGPGHLMAPSRPSMGSFNPGVAAAPALSPALGQALTALLATQGAGLGLNNLLGGLGAPMSQGMPQVMNNAGGYGNQAGASYGNQQGMQGGYQNPQMGQAGVGRTQPGGGAPYMGHGY